MRNASLVQKISIALFRSKTKAKESSSENDPQSYCNQMPIKPGRLTF